MCYARYLYVLGCRGVINLICGVCFFENMLLWRMTMMCYDKPNQSPIIESSVEKSGCTPASQSDIPPRLYQSPEYGQLSLGSYPQLNRRRRCLRLGNLWQLDVRFHDWLRLLLQWHPHLQEALESISSSDVRCGWWLDADTVSVNLTEQQQWFAASYVLD